MKLTTAATAVVFATTVALLSGCASTTTDSASDAAGSSADKLKVGIMIPGSISDAGFMESAYDGYESIKETLGDQVDVSYVEKVEYGTYQQALQQLASTSDMVISIGGQTDADVRLVAPSFPNVKFVEVGGPTETLDNLAMYDPMQNEIAYVAGALAALTSQTGTVGFISGMEQPAIVATGSAFAAGAMSANPAITVLSPQYTGDYSDVSKGKQASLADIAAGADVLYQILNEGLQGMEQAASETDTHVIAGPLPASCDAGSPYIGSTKSDIGAAALYAVQQAVAGTWKAEHVQFGLANPLGTSGIVYCDGVPDDVKTKLDVIVTGLADGTITP